MFLNTIAPPFDLFCYSTDEVASLPSVTVRIAGIQPEYIALPNSMKNENHYFDKSEHNLAKIKRQKEF